MAKLIGFMGKGGTGKSTLTALFLKYILQKNIKPALVIDADPNSCLAELLSLGVEATVGGIREELLPKNRNPNQIASATEPTNTGRTMPQVSKSQYCEYALCNSIVECEGYDLVVMGRPEGEGCYCYVNNIIKNMIEKLKRSYKLIIVDCEAGLEHLSRKTLGQINIAFIISNLSRKGILTGIKQAELMKELNIRTDNNYLIVNDIIDDAGFWDFSNVIEEANARGLKYAGMIRHDENIVDCEYNQKSLLSVDNDSGAYRDLAVIMDKINLLGSIY